MSPEHRALWEDYVKELREAKMLAELWWDEAGGAAGTLAARWPDGPASHPYVIGVIEKYLQACYVLNQRLGRAKSTHLNEFIIDSLMTSRAEDVLDFTDNLTYWPIGLRTGDQPV
jgi:hypothetical protein